MNFSDVKEQFEMIEKVGSGKYGDVWKVKYLSGNDDSFYALKLVFKHNTTNHLRLQRESVMMREINMLKDSEGYFPHFVRFIQFKNYDAILMEYVEGISLYKYFEMLRHEERVIEPTLLKKFMIRILRGINILHSSGIAHRDIKDENIIFNNTELKLIDLGFACYCDKNSEKFSLLEKDISVLGTPAFMAPEIWANEGEQNPLVYQKSDIWSAGLIFWELVSLNEPPDVDDFDELVAYKRKYDADDMKSKLLKRASKELSNTTENLRNIILLCLKPRPEDRPSVAELLKMLKN